MSNEGYDPDFWNGLGTGLTTYSIEQWAELLGGGPVKKYIVTLKVIETGLEVTEIYNIDGLDADTKFALSLATTVYKLSAPGLINVDISELVQELHDVLYNVPDHIGDMTKEEFYQDLADRFPDIFTPSPSGGVPTIKPAEEWPTTGEIPGEVPEENYQPPATAPYMQDGVGPQLNTPGYQASPLVLDLDGDGVELTSVDSPSAVYWDLDQDGMAEATGWVGPDDGLLAFDRNGDGIITDHSELFGTETDDGFLILAEFDSNGDGVINASDTGFENLIVWVDANTDGYSQEGELYSLSDLGITSIDLNYSEVNYEISGNSVSSESTFTMNGVQHQIVDTWFTYDNVNTVYAQDYTLDVRTLFLPTMRGYGDLPDMHIAMSLDNGTGGLLEMVQEVAVADVETLFSASFDLDSKIKDILFTWAGVENVDPGSRGTEVDARESAFLEVLTGESIQYNNSDTFYGTGALAIRNAFNDAYNAIAARLLVQSSAVGDLFTEFASYNSLTDTFEGNFQLDLTAIDDLFDNLGLSGSDLAATWDNLGRLIEATVGLENLSTADYNALDAIVEESDGYGGLTLDSVWDAIYEDGRLCFKGDNGDNTLGGGAGADIFSGLDGNDTLYGNGGRDTLYGDNGDDLLYGGSDNDTLRGGNGNDRLHGGTGNDTLDGGYGNDSYYYESGIDTIRETAGYDTIIFDSSITPAQISIDFSDTSYNDLHIFVDGSLAIRVEQYFSVSGGAVEYLRFSDGTIIQLNELTGLVEGTTGNDTLTGIDSSILPHDTLLGGDGNDTLDGGLGNDILKGGNGDDTYLIASGTDIVSDAGGADKITFGTGLNSTDVSYEIDENGYLSISFNDTHYATIENQFTSTGAIEILEFDNSVTVQTSTLQFDQNGTSSADTIFGYKYGADIDNTIYAGAGNDRIYSYEGDDVIYGEAGHDDIYASAGNDTLNGGAGDDYLDGGSGDDIYIVTSGTDTISDNSGVDKIVFGSAYDLTNMTLVRSGYSGRDLDIYFDGILTAKISYHFTSSDSIETLEFNDSSTFSLASYINVEGSNGVNDTLNGVDDTYFENDYIYGYSGDDTLNGGVGNDHLYGGSGDDTLNGGDDNDYLEGGIGEDTYIYSGAGDTYHDNGSQDQTDTISFGAGISSGDISFERIDRYDLEIKINGNSAILIENQFNAYDQIETLLFNDSSTLNLLDVVYTTEGTSGGETLYGTDAGAKSDILNGYAGNDRLYGYSGDDTLDGGLGEDDLYGGSGDDTYLITDIGDRIQDESGTDKIVFDSSYSINDLELARSGNSDLVISFNGTPTLTITNQFDQNDQIELLEFSDSSTFNLLTQSYTINGDANDNTLYGISYGGDPDDTLNGGDGNDTLYGYLGDDTLNGGAGDDKLYGGDGNDTYYIGTGVDTISDTGGSDIVYLDSGLLSGDMTYQRSGTYDLDIYFSGQKKLTLDNHFKAGGAIETLVFGDSSTQDLTSLSFDVTGTTGNDTLYGTDTAGGTDQIEGLAGDDYLYGYAGGDTLEGGLGNDTLNGGSGDDTYVWTLGDGTDTITEDGGTDTLVMHGVTLEDIRLEKSSYTLNVYVGSDYITITDQYRSDSTGNSSYDHYQIETLLLDDGTEIDLLDGVTFTGGAGNDYVYGMHNASGETLIGGEGNDYLYGYDGDDTYVWTLGDGTDTITEDGGTDTLVMHGVTLEDIRLEKSSYTLNVYVGSDYITITDQYRSDSTGNSSYDHYQIETLLLDDGTEIDLLDGVTFTGGAGNDYVYGMHNASGETLIGGKGNDILYGYDGDDTYVWTLGDGTDTITENGGTDTLVMHGVTLEDIRLEKTSYNLRVHVGSDYITITDQYRSDNAGNDSYDHYQIETLLLDDGTEIDLLDGVTFTGSDGDDYVYGMQNASGETLIGGPGNDTLYGYDGDDTYVWALGDGTDTITENGGTDTLVMHGVTLEDIRLEKTSYNLRVHVGSDYIEIDDQYRSDSTGSSSYDHYQIETLLLDDGTEIDLLDGVTFTGSDGDDYVYGMQNASGETLIGGGGDDILYGYGGHDTLYGGDGYDTLYGGEGADLFVFEADSAFNDIDLIDDFNLAEGDAIDLTDILTGNYNPSTDDITDFVQILDSGSDSLLKVDQNGGGDSFVTIATLDNVTGLIDEQSMLDNGYLIFQEAGNTVPVAITDSLTEDEDTAITGNVLADNGNGADSDADSHTLTVQAATIVTEQGISVSIASNGSFTYTPEANFYGEDSFDYVVLDGHGGRTIGTAYITITSVNDDPVAVDDAFTNSQGEDIIGNLLSDNGSGVDSDVENDTLSVQSGTYSTVQGGSIVITSDGSFTYTPLSTFTGQDSFDYTLLDGQGGSDTGTVNFTVTTISYNYVTGTSSGEYLYGSTDFDYIDGNEGNDYLYGYQGNDTYIWNIGDGYDTIYDGAGSADTIELGSGITANDVRLWNDGSNLLVYVNSEYIKINDHFDGSGEEVETLLFADSSTMDLMGDLTFTGTSSGEYVYGQSSITAADTLIGLEGNDYLYGYDGNDTYVWNTGDGYDTIYDSAGSADKIELGSGITANDVRLWNDGGGNLFVYVDDGYLKVNDHFDGTGEEIETLLFSDSSSWSLVNNLTFTGTSSNETVYATDNADTLHGAEGSDSLYGYDGNDTYVWNTGDGYDTIYDSAGSADKIELGSGITANDVRLWNDGGGNLFVYVDDGYLKVNDHFDGTGEEIETLLFSDSSSWSLVNNLTFTGTSSNETVYATDNADTLHGAEGSDSLYGYDGNDTYVWNTGDGYDTIYDSAGSADKIELGSGITANDVRLWNDGGGNLFVYVDDGYLKVNDHFDGTGEEVETLLFSDSSSWSLVNNLTFTGTSSNETVYATNNADTLRGAGGNDYLYGYDGDDVLYGGDGVDQLYGGSDADTFIFEADSAFNNVDIIKDYNAVDGDVVNIVDLLTSYDPMQDDIDDFVTLTETGGDTVISVDRDGTGTTYTAQDVVNIDNVTGLDLDDMITNGELLVA